jgi:pimeloyl-ACP methyl ester carboxylesterase/tetratricopeptide (TPR) repeat protein
MLFAAALVGCAHQPASTERPTVRKIAVSDTTLAYVEQGRGETVLFVHSADDWRAWEPVRPWIASKYRFVSYSRRYHSPNPADGGGKPYTVTQHADDLIAFLEAQGVGPVHVVGTTLGARIATEAALKRPELFRSLVLNDPAIIRPIAAADLPATEALARDIGRSIAAARARDTRQSTVLLIDALFGQPGAWDRQSPDLQQRYLHNQAFSIAFTSVQQPPTPSCERLGALKMPVLVIEGQHTVPGFRVGNDRLMQCLPPGSRRAVIADAPHLWTVANARAGAEALLTFVASTPTAHHAAGAAKLGEVHFKIECNAAAQREFNVAMAYYHSFAWHMMQPPLEAALRKDPSCGMVHWLRTLGALDNPFIWPGIISPATLGEGPRFLDAARRTGLRSQRERDYVEALGEFFKDADKVDHKARVKALEGAMERVMQRYPEDTEAAILYSLILSANFDPADKKYTNQLKAARILEAIFEKQPEHPGVAHYLIHSYDYPPIAKHGLDAARRYSRIAPDAPHALHMPSHIFTRVGAWKESIEVNSASARSAAGKSFDTWHAYDYLVYAHLQLGQQRAAQEVTKKALRSLERHIDHPGTAYAYAAMPARLAVERGDWKAAASVPLHAADAFPWKKYTFAEAINAYARGIGAALSGDAAGARKESARLRSLRDATKVPYWREEIDVQATVVEGLALCAEGDRGQCIRTVEAAADREDRTEKHAVTPGRLVPAREVLAYLKLEGADAAGALGDFEKTLERDPNRLRAFAGASRAAQLAGDGKKAADYATRVVELTKEADSPLAEVAYAKQLLGR